MKASNTAFIVAEGKPSSVITLLSALPTIAASSSSAVEPTDVTKEAVVGQSTYIYSETASAESSVPTSSTNVDKGAISQGISTPVLSTLIASSSSVSTQSTSTSSIAPL
ncbi:hypothetical protein N7495_009060 [Penicillium taxi]|uniref:uncharacterized protein n=1 Tax=Penicillium taxi TaxID=168475 RepID=UPI002545655E|nr:uncharacterized protein N7495_009060 [Penicillium taxi]KAJ5889019.1 hypothetical protein N7495_009060 [Penicillium taxi]